MVGIQRQSEAYSFNPAVKARTAATDTGSVPGLDEIRDLLGGKTVGQHTAAWPSYDEYSGADRFENMVRQFDSLLPTYQRAADLLCPSCLQIADQEAASSVGLNPQAWLTDLGLGLTPSDLDGEHMEWLGFMAAVKMVEDGTVACPRHRVAAKRVASTKEATPLDFSAYCYGGCGRERVPGGLSSLCPRNEIEDHGAVRDMGLVPSRYEGICMDCCGHNHG